MSRRRTRSQVASGQGAVRHKRMLLSTSKKLFYSCAGVLHGRTGVPCGLSTSKKVFYSCALVVTFFLLVEGMLAVADVPPTFVRHDPYVGFAATLPLFVEHSRDDTTALMSTAENKLAYFNAQQFAKQKPEGTRRVFCLGGSTTYGRPYDDRTSFPGWLRALLAASNTEQRWEVINAGGISYASYRVAAVMEELCHYSPDVFIVYTGHNEFLEERTYRDFQNQPEVVRRLTSLLHRTRTYSLAHTILRPAEVPLERQAVLPGEVDAILDHTVGPDLYERDEFLRAKVLEHFEFNLNRMIALARAAGAEILFVTPASNLRDFSPFKSENREDLGVAEQEAWSELLTDAAILEQRGELDEALATVQRAAQIDDRHAAMHYHRGNLLFAAEQFAEARRAYLRAIDEDVCPLRALPATSQIIERTAIRNEVPLVDFEAILHNDCLHFHGHDSPGNEYFLDHVHPTIEANRLLAIGLVEALIQRGLARPGTAWRDEAVRTASQQIESQIDPRLQARALTNLAQVLSWAGKQNEAGPIAVQAVQLRAQHDLPEDLESMFYAGVHLATTGENRAATDLLRRVVFHEPKHVQARWRLATLLYDQALYDEAEGHFLAAVQLDPKDADSHSMLGAIQLKSGETEQALESFLRAHAVTPDDAGVLVNLGSTVTRLGRDEEAIAWYQRAVVVNPTSSLAHRELARLWLGQGRVEQAIDHFEEIVRLDPESLEARKELRNARQQLPAN